MEAKLKALKVVDLKQILSSANVSAPAKSTKTDLIAKILASKPALDAYAKLHPPDDLLAPPEDVDWSTDQPEAATEPAPVAPQKAAPPKPPTTKPTPAATVPPPKPPPVATGTRTIKAAARSTSNTLAEDLELEKRKRRAERFGIPLVEPKQKEQPPAKKSVEDTAEKLEARSKRFADGKPDKTAPAAPNEKKRPAPKTEEVDPEELERRKKRAARFGVPVKS